MAGPVKSQAFKGWEVFWNELQMTLKMWGRLLLITAGVQVVILYLLANNIGDEKTRGMAQAYWKARVARALYLNPTLAFPYKNGAIITGKASGIVALDELIIPGLDYAHRFAPLLVASFGLYFLIPTILAKAFHRKSAKMQEREHVRGPQLVTADEIKRQIRKSGKKARLPFGGIKLPVEFEPEHAGIFGKTRVGKTVQSFQMIEPMRGHKAIILDVKGDYVAHFFDPTQDVIFNVLDKRGVSWNLFDEIRNAIDVEAVAHSMIPDAKGGGSNEQFFNDAARAVLVGALHVCIAENRKTNSALKELVFGNTELIEKAIARVDAGKRGHTFIQSPTSNLAGSVHAVLMQYAGWLEYLTDDPEAGFSLTEWITDGRPGFLYLSTKKEVEKTLRPVISLFVDLAARRILSLPDDRKRRIYFLLDEFGSLQRLNAIKDLLTVGGGKGAMVTLTIQDFAQVQETYGRTIAQTIFNSLGTIMSLKLKDPDTAEFLAKTFGKAQFWETKESHVMGPGENHASITQNKDKREEFVVTGSEIQYLKKLEYILQIPDYDPCRGKLDILPVNNKSAICPDFILRDGLDLDEIYLRQREAAAAAAAAGIVDAPVLPDLEEDLDDEEKKLELQPEKEHDRTAEKIATIDIPDPGF